MSQILPNGGPNDVCLRCVPTHARLQPVRLQPHKRSLGQLDVASLRGRQLCLALLDPAALFEPAMIALDPKCLPCVRAARNERVPNERAGCSPSGRKSSMKRYNGPASVSERPSLPGSMADEQALKER